MAKRGRKEKYNTHVKPYLNRIPIWRRQGMTEEQICYKLGIHVDSLNVYKKKFPELSEALHEGKAELIEKLEETLYNRAMGIEYEETKSLVEKVGKKEKKKVEKVKKFIAPDVEALKFALKNLDKEKWRDKHDVEHSGVTGVVFVDDIDDIPDEDDINDSGEPETETEDY